MKKSLRFVCSVAMFVSFAIAAMSSAAEASTDGSISGSITGIGEQPSVFLQVSVCPGLQTVNDCQSVVQYAGDPSDFEFPHLAPGTWSTCVDGTYARDQPQGLTYWQDYSWCGSDVGIPAITVTSGADTAVPLQFTTIYGTVTNPDGNGVQGVHVDAYASGAQTPPGSVDLTAQTDESGNYYIPFVPVFGMKLKFDPIGTGYQPQWYDNKTSYQNATVLSTSATAGSTANAQLTGGATLAGTLKLPKGATYADADVQVLDPASGEVKGEVTASRSANAAERGKFRITGLAPGNYAVSFGQEEGAATAPGRFYSGVKEQDGLSNATQVTLTVGATTTINDALQPRDGGKLTGRIVRNHRALKNYTVSVFSTDYGHTTREGTSNSIGHFSVTGLSPGTYQIGYCDPPFGCYAFSSRVFTVKAGRTRSVGTVTN